ncbi:probable G-protein coupled receptor 139 [Scyliorhinus torazame]|uniref:probable G-protein coupled receptor 139 n=1 Tax=Scyliorhinus torazame TaxID=75743 RepID=UPI003B5C6638
MLLSIHMAEKIFYMIVALIGVPVDLLGIVILSRGKCGLSTCTTCYLVAMATADLLVIISQVILNKISYYYFPVSFLDITPVCGINAVVVTAATECSVWFTVTFSFDRFVAICCQKLKTKYCTKKTAILVLATTSILSCSVNLPYYFTNEPAVIIGNVPWGCRQKPSTFTDPRWMGYNWFLKVLMPFLPFASILLFNALTVRHILVASRVRKELRGQNNGANHSDPEMQSRRKSMILLFAISGSFILLWFLYVVNFLYYTIRGLVYLTYSEFTLQQVGFLLADLNCCTNTFIYGVTQYKFREQVKKAVTYPFALMIKLMNKQNN